MSGLGIAAGLSQALIGYQQGNQWKQQQEQIARQQKMQAERDAVDQESAGMMKQALQDHVMRGGKPNEFRPPEDLMFRLGEQRSTAFATRGMVNDFYANEAKLAPLRMQARAKAVQEYKADRDPVKFIMALNRSQFNGKDIEAVELVEGAESVQGLPARKGGIQVRFKGEKKPMFVDPEALAKSTEMGLLEPKDWAKSEADAALKRLQSKLDTEKGLALAAEQGAQARTTDDRRTRNDEGLAKVRFGYDSKLREQQDAEAMKRTEKTVAGGLAQTELGGHFRVRAAEISADNKDSKTDKRVKSFKEIHGEVTRVIGMPQQGAFGGSKVSDEETVKIARGAEALMAQNPDIDVGSAIEKSIAEWRRRGGPPRPAVPGQ